MGWGAALAVSSAGMILFAFYAAGIKAMENPQVDPAWIAHAKLAFASLAGGMVRLFLRPVSAPGPVQAVLKSAWLLFGCVTCGFYGTPPLLDWFGLGEPYAGAVGAILGLIGLSIAEGLLKAVDGFEFKQWLVRMIGVKRERP
jgi:hypothetical protein